MCSFEQRVLMSMITLSGMATIPLSATGLYWSVLGHVACADHAAAIPSPRWRAEAWTPVPTSSQGFRGLRYECEYCSPQHTAVTRPQGFPLSMFSPA